MMIRTEVRRIKYHKNALTRILAVALVSILLLAIPAAPVLAQQAITLSHASGFLGDKVTVTGTGFHSYQNTYVALYFGDFKIKDIGVSESGDFTTDFNVPGYVTPGSSYRVTIRDAGGKILAEKSFIVGAKILPEPNEGVIGKSITLNGLYFDADKEIRLYFSSDIADIGDNIDDEVTAYEYLGIISTDTEGSFDGSFRFKIPGQHRKGTERRLLYLCY